MGTPLPEIITERGIECPICPEITTPFPDGPTPLNPIMTFEGWSEGDLWNESYRPKLEAGAELLQMFDPCRYVLEDTPIGWAWFNDPGFADIRIITINPFVGAFFTATPAIHCQITHNNRLISPVGNITFGGTVKLTWGEIV